MENYWNKRFIKEKFMWGIEPSKVAVECEKYFSKNNVKNILVMGIGYGRNGKYFIEKGYSVDGVENSEVAINLGKIFCQEINYIYGSVFDIKLDKKYDAIFCYSILHLFEEKARNKLLQNCMDHCKDNGIIVVSSFSIKDKTYGKGKKIEENTFEVKEGKIVHFYSEEEIKNIHKNLENITIDYSIEEVETEERKEEYKMIYGIYKMRKSKTSA